MKNINPPNTFDYFGSVFGYDYQIHKWVYDVKFYLCRNHWCFDKERKRKCRTIDENELKIIDKYNGVIEEHEKENAAWLAHKQCRKRSCVCKKCEKYCHCYDCVEKINECDNFMQE